MKRFSAPKDCLSQEKNVEETTAISRLFLSPRIFQIAVFPRERWRVSSISFQTPCTVLPRCGVVGKTSLWELVNNKIQGILCGKPVSRIESQIFSALNPKCILPNALPIKPMLVLLKKYFDYLFFKKSVIFLGLFGLVLHALFFFN